MNKTLQKLLAKTDKSTGCWVYLGQPASRYSEIMVATKRIGTHRWAYQTFHGNIPKGFEVDHICRTPKCWNPDHLQILLCLDNARQNKVAEANALKTHCVHNHEFTAENIYWYAGARHCRTCRRLNNRLAQRTHLCASA